MDARTAFSELYREIVLDHARAPQHVGTVDDATGCAAESNPLCGDRVSLTLRLDANSCVDAIGHVTDGCLLCVASASMMTTKVIGLPAEEIANLRTHLETLTAGGDHDPALGDLRAFAGVAAYPSRHRCVLLPWQALSDALCEATPKFDRLT